MRCSFTAYS